MKKVFFAFVAASIVALASCSNTPKTDEAAAAASDSVAVAVEEVAAAIDSTNAAAIDSAVAK